MTITDAVSTYVVDFRVFGIPKPQGSKKAFHHRSTGRIVMTEAAGAPLRDWRSEVKQTAAVEMVGRPVICQPSGIGLTVEFILPRPVSLPKTKATPLAVKKPDLDKLVRAVCDALKGVVYADDSQVVSMTLSKRTAEMGERTGARIGVETLNL